MSGDFNYYFGFVVEDCRAWALGIPENLDVSSPTRVEQLSYNNFYKNQKLNINWYPVRVFDICSERRSDYKLVIVLTTSAPALDMTFFMQ